MAVKRKASVLEEDVNLQSSKKQQIEKADIGSAFRTNLFEPATSRSYQESYAKSGPYPHAVVPALIEDGLLRKVRTEITENISFTLKETDIYRIHQSGDLANLSNLDKESLVHLPSLVRLRDALYSSKFRQWVSDVTGAGKLSGQKTDMAVNVYTPGSYLLCHDDVIGSRRVSYILYLTDPDKPWKSEWGGGLRLHPTELRKNKAGEKIKVPLAEHSLNIPPSFGQLSFFTVVPGESYHDVEEVYHGKNLEEDGGRIRMAISGWYHIPQEGEDGYEAGVEQALAQKSSLTQLKSAANEFDEPQIKFRHFDEPRMVMNSNATEPQVDPGDEDDQDEDLLTEVDLTFLLQYISASFLAPDMVEQIAQSFEETSMLQLEKFLCEKFSAKLKHYIAAEDKKDSGPAWKVARPPHKHRYAYLQDNLGPDKDDSSPISRLLIDLLHSHAFKKWLALVTGLRAPSLTRQNAIARRFRRGKDYALASPYQGEQPQLEFTLGLTPTPGWDDEQNVEVSTIDGSSTVQESTNGHSKPTTQVELSKIEYGGEEVYMAGDDEDDDSHHNHPELPHVGRKADPAVYRSGDGDDEEGGGILFANTPAWNQFSVVLRDKGTLRFIKYISQAAAGDRWDIKGEVELSEDAFAGEEDEEDGDQENGEDDEGEGEDGEENYDEDEGGEEE